MTARFHATVAAAALALGAALLPAVSHATNGFIFLGSLNEYANGPFGPWDYSDVWGYTDPITGDEYAILGTGSGTSIINVTDPFNPYETGFIAGNTSGWRDMHTYQGRLYITTEGQDSLNVGGGLQIVSLADPEAPLFVRRKHTFTAHTLWIDEGTGVAYCNGAGGLAQGFKAYNLNANLDNPPLIVDNGAQYIHDIWVGNGVAYTADINAGGQMRILDISALPGSTTITQTGIVNYASGATHNTWPHPDGIHVVTTDEICSSGFVRVWDVSDPQNIIQVATIPAVPGTDVHNVYMKGTTLYAAWYAAGIRAYDLADPTNPVLLGAYDTQPGTNGCFGCWSVYPFLPSGVIACADMSQGLVLVAHVGASGFISGTISTAALAPLDSAIVNVPGFYNKKVATDANGAYTFELPAGATTVIVSADGYLSDTQVVTINANATTTHDVVLSPAATGVGAGTGAPAIALSSAYPNPARGASSLDFALPADAVVRAEVFDASGRRVRALASGTFPAGRHTLAWDARDDAGRPAAAGTYLYRVETAGESRSVKMTLVR